VLASRQALRLALLVATASAAGYLWRAALEPPDREHGFGLQPPGLRFKVPETAFQPLLLLTPTAGEGHHRVVSQAQQNGQGGGQRSGDATLIASITPTASSRRQRPGAPTRAQSRHAARKARKVGTKPAPPPPPPPAANPPAPPPPPAQQPPPPPPAPVRTRPGWGRGDKNHVHTGPPGQQKKKKSKSDPTDQANEKGKKDKSDPAGKEKGKKNGKDQEQGNRNNSGQDKEKGKKNKK
jgi:hypothetical protein